MAGPLNEAPQGQTNHYPLSKLSSQVDESHPEIILMNTGAIIAQQEPILEIKAYADIFVALTSEHTLDQSWLASVTQVDDMIDRYVLIQLRGITTDKHPGLKTLLKERTKAIKRRLVRTQNRAKRGLFNFIGDIGSSLFGIPSASDIEGLKEANKVLTETVDGVIRTQRKTVARVNLLGRVQQQISVAVNKLIEHQAAQDQILRTVAGQTRDNTWMIRVTTLLDVIEDRLSMYEEALGQVQAIRIACEARLVTEQVVPIAIADQIQPFRPLITVTEYYAYIQVRNIITTDQGIFCVLRAPEFEEYTSTLYGIQTFPIEQNDKYLQIYQPDVFVLKPTNEELYYPSECHGPKPQACRPGIVYDKSQKPCLHGLITHDSEQMKQCPMTILTKPPSEQITIYELNKYFVYTEHTIYHYRCPNTQPISRRIDKGHYLITVKPTCVIDTPLWNAKGFPIRTVNITLPIIQPQPIPTEWLTFPNETGTSLVLPKLGLDKITVPSYSDLVVPNPPDIIGQIRDIQSNIGVNATPWWIWLILALVGMVVLCILFCYIKHKCMGQSDTKVQRQTVHYDAKTEGVNLDIDTPTEQPVMSDSRTQTNADA